MSEDKRARGEHERADQCSGEDGKFHRREGKAGTRAVASVRAAMLPGTKLVLCELFVPTLTSEPLYALSDLQMMVACARGRERSQEQLERLVVAAGFTVGRAFPSPTICVLEAVAKGDRGRP